jgi:hypothetical protein
MPDQEMIERVAKAIKDDWLANNSKNIDEFFKSLSKAAIKAMRKPTKKMINIEELPYSLGEMKDYWQSMIDSILND